MAQDLFRIALGLDIESNDGSTNAYIIQGNGLPGGDAAEQDDATIGSLYLQTDAETNNLQLYWKYRTTQNSFGDWQQVVSKEFLNSVINGISWREPVSVLDNTTYANVAAIPVTGTIDGVVLSDGDRVLFTDLTTGNDNVYIWDAGGTSWTESTNTPTDGDTILVKEGTSAEEQWTYDGTTWVQTGGASNANELGFIRDFIGKNGTGAENPLYTSITNITQNSSLESVIGELDATIGDNTFTDQNFINSVNTVNTNLNVLDVQLGTGNHSSLHIIDDDNTVTENFTAIDFVLGDRSFTNTSNHVLSGVTTTITVSLEQLNLAFGSRNYTNGYNITNGETATQTFDKIDIALGNTNHTSTNIISNATSINDNLTSLDASIGNQTYTNDNVVTDGETITASIDALDSQLGDNTYTESNIVSTSNNITENLNAIDIIVNENALQTAVVKTTGVSAQTVVDSIPVADAEVAKWIISYENAGNATNRESLEVHALHDGTTVKWDEYSIRRFGNAFTGLSISCDINAGSLRLLVSSVITVDVAVKRIGYYTIN